MGHTESGCYAADLGDCSGPLNREHFISDNLLQEFKENGGVQITGFPHGNDSGKSLGVPSIAARVLCESHNRRLSDVDVEGGGFVKAFLNGHNGLLKEEVTADQIYEFNGPLIERWLLKYGCGLIASGQAGSGTQRVQKTPPPLGFLQVLFGLETLPAEWGLYTRRTSATGALKRKELSLGLYLPLQLTGARRVCGVKMEHYGLTSVLALTAPQKPFAGTDLDGSLYHPEFFKLSYKPTGRSVVISVNWPDTMREVGFAIELHKGDLPLDSEVGAV